MNKPLNSICHAVVLTSGDDVKVQDVKQHSFYLLRKLGVVLSDKRAHKQVNDRTESLHNIVRKIEAVQATLVMQAERRNKAIYSQVPCNAAADYCIAVVERGIKRAVIAS